MKLPRVRFTVRCLMIAVAALGIVLAFLRSLIIFLDSPFLAGPREEAEWAPVLFVSRASLCGAALWLVLFLRERFPRRDSPSPEDRRGLTVDPGQGSALRLLPTTLGRCMIAAAVVSVPAIILDAIRHLGIALDDRFAPLFALYTVLGFCSIPAAPLGMVVLLYALLRPNQKRVP
jgi:hypothetical protein